MKQIEKINFNIRGIKHIFYRGLSIIIILILFNFDIFADKNNDNDNISLRRFNNTNNKGFLKINTTHKSKFTYYNYSNNILLYKDLYNNTSYTPITELNYIVKSNRISRKQYYKLCKNKILLNNIKYKRSIKPRISVIIPYYNKDIFSIFIPLRSIQNQSFKDIEIIIVDDGSSETKIKEVINEMENDNRIILLKHKNNKGTLLTRVDGVRYASGDYILNIDQDDLFIDNLLFENIYKKATSINVDILQFSTLCYKNIFQIYRLNIDIPKNKLITQPDLQVTFLKKIKKNRLSNFSTRMIWDKMVKREIYLECINELGNEYLNHKFFLYEDTLMMFELSQIAYSYYYYNIVGYRLNVDIQGKSRDKYSNSISIKAMNQLFFIKLLLFKISPSYDRYHIFAEWGHYRCGSNLKYLDCSDIDLLKEVIEAVEELERIYKNTDKNLLKCINKIKNNYELT